MNIFCWPMGHEPAAAPVTGQPVQVGADILDEYLEVVLLRMHDFSSSASMDSFGLAWVPLEIEKERGTAPKVGGPQASMLAFYVCSPFRFSLNITHLMIIIRSLQLMCLVQVCE